MMLQHSPGSRPRFGEDSHHQGFLQLLYVDRLIVNLMG
jgi:hypothetical protein